MSKGSWRRPAQVSEEELSSNWEKAFGKKTEDGGPKKKEECCNCGDCNCDKKSNQQQVQ